MEANRTVSEGAGAGEARRTFGSSISTLPPAKPAAMDPAPRRTKSRRVNGNIFFMADQTSSENF
jgi:hypothetical protein